MDSDGGKSFKINISPQPVVLYDSTPHLRIYDIREWDGRVLQLESCDITFTSGAEPVIYVDAVPHEKVSHLSSALRAVGMSFVILQGVTSIFFIMRTIYYWNHDVVRRSQPIFIVLVLVGFLVMSLSIQRSATSMSASTNEMYRPKNVEGIDAACMAFPWLSNMGFVLTFSALFAKIGRIRKLTSMATGLRRGAIEKRTSLG